jgi:hypothetical protein
LDGPCTRSLRILIKVWSSPPDEAGVEVEEGSSKLHIARRALRAALAEPVNIVAMFRYNLSWDF